MYPVTLVRKLPELLLKGQHEDTGKYGAITPSWGYTLAEKGLYTGLFAFFPDDMFIMVGVVSGYFVSSNVQL